MFLLEKKMRQTLIENKDDEFFSIGVKDNEYFVHVGYYEAKLTHKQLLALIEELKKISRL